MRPAWEETGINYPGEKLHSLRELSTTTWVKEGLKFEHFYPNNEGVKELQF
jgi:hypothetical protein